MLSVGLMILSHMSAYMHAPIVSEHESKRSSNDDVYTQQSVEFLVNKGASFSAVTTQLQQLKLIQHPIYFKIWATYKQQTQSIKPGEYVFTRSQSPQQILLDLVSGKVKKYQITIVEGKRFKDFIAELQQHPKIVKTITDLNQVYQRFNVQHESLEGLFAPNTYTFDADITDMQILQQSHQLLMRQLQEAWDTRDHSVKLKTPYEALILASIVEKETSVPNERARIAGVFLTRLQRDMRLQTDPTVIYGLGESFDGNLTRKHLRAANPYNTYVNKGLPPSPIALVSKASIMAVMNPEWTGDLYFVSKKDGTHYFSKTYREHVQAVREYQLN